MKTVGKKGHFFWMIEYYFKKAKHISCSSDNILSTVVCSDTGSGYTDITILIHIVVILLVANKYS